MLTAWAVLQRLLPKRSRLTLGLPGVSNAFC